MAIAGSMTTAYKVSFIFGELTVTRTTYPQHSCVNPKDAAGKVRSGEHVIVAGSDMTEFRKIWEALV